MEKMTVYAVVDFYHRSETQRRGNAAGSARPLLR